MYSQNHVRPHKVWAGTSVSPSYPRDSLCPVPSHLIHCTDLAVSFPDRAHRLLQVCIFKWLCAMGMITQPTTVELKRKHLNGKMPVFPSYSKQTTNKPKGMPFNFYVCV